MWVTWAPIWNSADDLPLAAIRQLRPQALDGGARGIRFDVHDDRFQAGRFDYGDAVLDLFLARGRQQDFHILRGILRPDR